jgi:hypothetical protein
MGRRYGLLASDPCEFRERYVGDLLDLPVVSIDLDLRPRERARTRGGGGTHNHAGKEQYSGTDRKLPLVSFGPSRGGKDDSSRGMLDGTGKLQSEARGGASRLDHVHSPFPS